jgi:hypothetical protein
LGCCGGAIFWARSAKVTPQSFAKYLEIHSIRRQVGAPESEDHRGEVAEQMNALSYEERREVRLSRKWTDFSKG